MSNRVTTENNTMTTYGELEAGDLFTHEGSTWLKTDEEGSAVELADGVRYDKFEGDEEVVKLTTPVTITP